MSSGTSSTSPPPAGGGRSTQKGAATAGLRKLLHTQHPGVGDGHRAHRAECQRVGIVLRPGGGIADGAGARIGHQRVLPGGGERPNDLCHTESLGTGDVFAHPPRQCGEVTELHLDADGGVVHHRQLLTVLVPGPA